MTETTLYYPAVTQPVWRSDYAKIEIAGDEYAAASNGEMWASSKTGQYGQGMINSASDPKRVERIGRLGEIAFAKLIGLGVDLAYCQGGDQYDFMLRGLSIDVKTSSKACGYGLVLAENERGIKIRPKCDRYVFACLDRDDPRRQVATVTIAGYIARQSLMDRPSIPGFKNGKHRNYLVFFNELQPIRKIVDAAKGI